MPVPSCVPSTFDPPRQTAWDYAHNSSPNARDMGDYLYSTLPSISEIRQARQSFVPISAYRKQLHRVLYVWSGSVRLKLNLDMDRLQGPDARHMVWGQGLATFPFRLNLSTVSEGPVPLFSLESRVCILKDRNPVGPSASRPVGSWKWTALIGRTGFDTIHSTPNPTLSLSTIDVHFERG